MAYPAVPGVSKVTLTWSDGTGNYGARFFDAIGTGASGAELSTFAAAIAGYWETNLSVITPSGVSLVEVTVEDLSSDTSSTGTWTGAHAGSASGIGCPSNVALDFQAQIPKRYRGGHPCFHHPPPVFGELLTYRTLTPGFLATALAAWNAFIGDVNAYDTAPIEPDGITVLLGYKNDAIPEAVTQNVIESYKVRPVVGTMRRRLQTSP